MKIRVFKRFLQIDAAIQAGSDYTLLLYTPTRRFSSMYRISCGEDSGRDRTIVAVIIRIFTIFILLQPAARAAPPTLFESLPPAAMPPALAQLSAAAMQRGRLSRDLFFSPRGQRFRARLRSDYEIDLVQDRIHDHKSGSRTWVGQMENAGKGFRAVVTRGTDGTVVGTIVTPRGRFKLITQDGATLLLDENAAGLRPPPNVQYDTRAAPDVPSAGGGSAAAPPTAASAAAGDTVVDVMLMYTPGMVITYPGSALQARLDHLIALSNLSLDDSQVPIALRMVHAAEVDYTDFNDNGVALDRMTDGTGAFSNVATLRNQHGADLVALIRPYKFAWHGGCGIAYVLGENGTIPALDIDYAYSVTSDGFDFIYSCDDYTLPHELGHNMGNAHDRLHAGIPGVFPYSFGHGFNGRFGTIMSYISPAVGLFSNPDLQCNGFPCGVAEGQPGQAHNALSMTNIRQEVENFRPAVAADAVTRALAAVWILRAKYGTGYTPPSIITTRFDDAAGSDFAAAWIEQLADEGITEGCSATSYCPRHMLTRDSLAILLLRAKHGSAYTPPTITNTRYDDVGGGDFAAAWIEQLAAEGITAGCDGTNYCPKAVVSQLDFDTMLARTFGLVTPSTP